MTTGHTSDKPASTSREDTNRDNQIWRIRKINSSIGGWVVERGWWYRSQKLVRDGVGPMRFHSSEQSHFHSEAAARARLQLATTAPVKSRQPPV